MTNQYRINVTLDCVNRQVTGSETISLLGKPSRLDKGLLLGFSLPSVKGCRRLEVSAKGRPVHLVLTEATSPEQEKQFYLELPQSAFVEDPVTLECVFSGKLPEPQRDIVLLIDDWHPKIRSDRITFDDYEVTATLPEKQVLISTGSETRIDTLTDYQRRYELTADKVGDFGLITSECLGMVEGRAGNVLVRSYYLPETERWGRPLLDYACDTVNFYREEFGFYPQNRLSVMPGHKGPTGGWPVTSNVVAIHDLDKLGVKAESFARWIIAHEIGHQYWGGYVGCSEFPGWLEIGLGIHMDRSYSEARGLERSHHESFTKRYIRGLREGVDTTVMQPPENLRAAAFDYNNIIVHGKGYAIISMLEQVLGKDLFRHIYDEALRRFRHSDIGTRDFHSLCEELSGEDLDWFFYQWLHTNRYLSYHIASEERSKRGEAFYLKVKVERMADARMPIPVQATFQDGTRAVLWTNRALRVSELTFAGSSAVEKVELDPDGCFPLVYPPLEPTELDVAREVSALPWVGSGERAGRVYEKACKAGLKSESLWFKLGLTLYDGEFYDKASEALKRVQELGGDPMYVFLALLWQGHILDLLGRRDEALEFYQRVYEKLRERGFEGEVRHDQYGLVINKRWVEERLRSPFRRPGGP